MTVPFSPAEIWSFIGIVGLLVMFPGPNTVLVMQSVCHHGRRAGLYNVLGVVCAVYANALLSGLGLSLIIMRSAEVYTLLKLAGAGYIVYLGVTSLVDACRLHGKGEGKGPGSGVAGEYADDLSPSGGAACFLKGLLTGVLNPKSAVFFLAFFPQFMHPTSNIVVQTLFLTVIYSLVSITWYTSLVFFVGKLRPLMLRRTTQKWLKAVTGTLLVGMGVKIALQR